MTPQTLACLSEDNWEKQFWSFPTDSDNLTFAPNADQLNSSLHLSTGFSIFLNS